MNLLSKPKPALVQNTLLLLWLGGLMEVGASVIIPEKDELKFGFIKLTDCAPLVIAKEDLDKVARAMAASLADLDG